MLIEQQTQYAYLGFDHLVRVNPLINECLRVSVWERKPWGEFYDLDNDPNECVNFCDTSAWQSERNRLLLELVHRMQSHQDMSPYPLDKG